MNPHSCCFQWGFLGGPCATLEFSVTDAQGNKNGELKKVHAGMIEECCTGADKYQFEFPSGGDSEKAIFLGALFLLDMLYFESFGHGP